MGSHALSMTSPNVSTVNNVTVNVREQVSLPDPYFNTFVYIPRNEVVELYVILFSIF